MPLIDGFTGIPFRVRQITRKANPEILKQWQALDEEKKKKRVEKELRDAKKMTRVPRNKTKATPKKVLNESRVGTKAKAKR